jgi:signal transduction histidine kinase
MMLAAGVALLLTAGAFTGYELHSYRESASREARMIAGLISESSTAALVFADARTAGETLAILRGEPQILDAAIYTRNGQILADYTRGGGSPGVPRRPGAPGLRIEDNQLKLFHVVTLDGESIGTVYVRRDLSQAGARLRQYLWIVLAVLVASSLVTLVVSSRLQALITRPILALAETATRVARENNYAIRAERLSDDEIGLLTARFNEMMSRILARDKALQKAQDQLEQRVQERTLELEQEIQERRRIEQKLLAANRLAEESSRAKSAFLANMSHELRTPLNAVIGYSEMLEEDAQERGDKASVDDLRKIGTAGRHLLALINDILDLSKIEAGRMELRPEWLRVEELVYEVVTTVEPLVRKNRNRLTVQREWPGEVVWADAVRFRQSLVNLLSNACKFTENGTVTLELAEQHRQDGRWLLWRVRDTGIGISRDNLTKLFQSFSQVDSSTTRRHGGTGLGLAISQRLCQMMGGEITVEGEVGKGSAFTIRLPHPEICEMAQKSSARSPRPAGG